MKKVYLLSAALCVCISLPAFAGEHCCGGHSPAKKSVSSVETVGNTTTVKNSDGETLVFGSTEWPKSDFFQAVPKFTSGKIVSSVETAESVLGIIESAEPAPTAEYLKTIKSKFNKDSYEMNYQGTTNLGGGNGSLMLYIVYDQNAKTLSISCSKNKN
ncbi:MAG: hypothetical protein WCS82_04405 [Candidatus Riflebacteria bacterium]